MYKDWKKRKNPSSVKRFIFITAVVCGHQARNWSPEERRCGSFPLFYSSRSASVLSRTSAFLLLFWHFIHCASVAASRGKKKNLQIFPPEQPHLIRFLDVSTLPSPSRHHPSSAEPRESATSGARSIFKFHLCCSTVGERPTASTLGDCYTLRRTAALGRHLAETEEVHRILHLVWSDSQRTRWELKKRHKKKNRRMWL